MRMIHSLRKSRFLFLRSRYAYFQPRSTVSFADAKYTPGSIIIRTPERALAPVALLVPWSGYVVVPVFALANAGVHLSADLMTRAVTSPVTIGIFVALVAGKFLVPKSRDPEQASFDPVGSLLSVVGVIIWIVTR